MTAREAAAALRTCYPPDVVTALMDEARRFPCRWAYASDRARAVCHQMPSRRWQVADTEATEARIAALRRRE